VVLPSPQLFNPLPQEQEKLWMRYGGGDKKLFVNLVGLSMSAVRLDYCKIDLKFRPELLQAGGFVLQSVADLPNGALTAPSMRTSNIKVQQKMTILKLFLGSQKGVRLSFFASPLLLPPLDAHLPRAPLPLKSERDFSL
jgi:hypothetical protein